MSFVRLRLARADHWLHGCPVVFALMAGLVEPLHGGVRTSPAYEVAMETIDPGGGFAAGASYVHQAGFSGFAHAVSTAAPAHVFRSGYVGQLYEVLSFQVSAPAGSVRTGTQFQLAATQQLDDGTLLALDPNRVQWSVTSGPLAGVAPAGIGTTGAVLADAPATIRGEFGPWSDELTLTVLAKLAQVINFTPPGEIHFRLIPLGLSATATSGLPVGFSVVTGPATVSGANLTMLDHGTVTVRAVQVGDADYAAASPLERIIVIRVSFDHWRKVNFTLAALADANVSGPNAIFSHDGLTNLIKYAVGLDPKTDVTAGLPFVATTSSDWVYTYSRPADRTDLAYAVEVSTDLTNWTTGGVTHQLIGSASGIETWAASYPLTSAPSCYFRLKVIR